MRGERNVLKMLSRFTPPPISAIAWGAVLFFVLLVFSCSFLSDDGFFSTVESEVAVANAEKMSVYLRYANTRFGKTTPVDASSYTVKNNVAFSVSAVTNTDYGFYKWAAFSTEDFDTGKQWTSLVFTNEDEYEEKFAAKELGDSVVHFADPMATTSEVTVRETRGDIWIIPIVAQRPTIQSTFPDTSKNPVVNAKLRIQFSKPMDESSFEDNYTIGIGSLSGDFELNLTDRTDEFKIEFNESKKLLTFSFIDPSKEFSPGSNVQISFTESVRDTYGYSMSASENKRWTISNYRDSSAPEITVLSGGIEGDFTSFSSIGKAAGKTATPDLSNAMYTDELFAQRTSGKVNLYVYAQDLSDGSSDRVESDVLMVGFRASTLVDRNGVALDASDSENSIARSESTYASGLNISDVSGSVSAILGESSTGGGTLYTYDVGSLPDGLIRIDVWAYDMTGNNGLDEYGATGNDDGFKTIFVVKDVTAPDIAAELGKVRSSSASAPYGWYNSNTIDPIEMYDDVSNPVVDAGHEKLRAAHGDMKWMFHLGDDTAWTVSRTDSAWRSLDERYPVGNARVDSDGSVSITMRLMDDLGNMSEARALSSVLYDNTKVEVAPLSWVDTAGNRALNASQSAKISDASLLKIPFTEELSGMRVMGVHIKDSSGTEVSHVFDSASVYYSESADSEPSLANAVSLETDNSVLSTVTESPHYNESNPLFTDTLENLHIFPAELKSGVLYIKNLTLGDADGVYTVTVTLYDSALNRSDAATITIAHDTTAPAVDRVIVQDVVERTVYGETEKTWWLPHSVYDSERKANLARISVTATENGSGIKKITLGANARFTAESVLYKDGRALNPASDYTLDVSANTITLSDSYNPVLYAQSGSIAFTITNVALNNPDSASGNSVSVTLTDFVGNDGSNADSSDSSKFRLYIDDRSSAPIYAIYGDTRSPSLTASGISDGKADSASDENAYAALRLSSAYTDQKTVTLALTLGSEAAQHGSGVKSLTLQEATFTGDTAISVDGTRLSGGFTLSGETVSFEKVFAGANTITFTNVLLSGSDGTRSVGAVITDLTGWQSESKASNAIILDTQKPECGSLSWELLNGVTGITKSALIESQNLVIPFSEETSGIRQLTLEAKESGATATSTPFRDAGFAVSYAASGSSSRTPLARTADYEIDGSRIKFTKPYKSGTFYLTNLVVSDSFADSKTYELTVHLTDFALNGAAADKTIAIVSDATAPALESIEIKDLVPRTKAGASTADSHWIPRKDFTAANTAPTKSVLAMSVTEKASGVKTIALGGTIRLTDSSGITVRYANGTEKTLEKGADYEVANGNALITLKNAASPLLKDEGGAFTLTITNTTLTGEGENTIFATLTDFALNSDSTSTRENKAFVDKTLPIFDSLTISDRGADVALGTLAAKAGFTNETLVNLTVAGAYDAGSGLSGIVIDSGATFTAETALEINEASVDFTKVSDSEITFASAYLSETAGDTFTILVKNARLSSDSDGTKSVSAHLCDKAGWSSASQSASINLDQTPPKWHDALPVVTGENTAGVYPAAGKAGESISSETYFYIIGTDSAESEMKLSLTYTEAHFAGALYSGSASTVSAILSAADAQTADTDKNIPFATNGDAAYSIVLKDDAGNVSQERTFHVIRDTAIMTNAGTSADSLTSVMEKSDSRAGYQVYLEKVAQSDGSYRNRFSTSEGKTVSVSVSLSSYTERIPSASQSGLAYFAINASDSTAPTTNGTATDFDKWIPYNAASETVTVFIPNENALKGPYYLWLKDNVGNTNKIQIRTPAHETSNIDETWLGSASVAQPSLIDYVLGTAETATTEKDGTLVTSGGVSYYNSNAKYGLKGEGGILFMGAASSSDYPVRFALVSKTASTALTKSEIAAISDWILPEDFNSASSEYAFINQPYPTVSGEYLHYVVEDATGNFATGLLNPLSNAASSKWKYDNAAPLVTLNDSGKTALGTSGVSGAQIATLIPRHYGKQVFYDSANSVIWVSKAGAISDSSATLGENTAHGIEKSLYFDLTISEETAITQYCYDSAATVSESTAWISATAGKVDTSIPVSKLSDTSATRLYLHVRDIVGNIATYPLSEVAFRIDETQPAFASETTPTPAYKLRTNYYYTVPNLTTSSISIALSGTAFENDSVAVIIPQTWFTDQSAGLYAYSLEKDSVPISVDMTREEDSSTYSPCIHLEKGTHYTSSGEKAFNMYVYDSVGNCFTVPVTTRVDTEPPRFQLAFSIYNGAAQKTDGTAVTISGNTGLIYDAIKDTESPADSLNVDYIFRSTNTSSETPGYSEEKPYIIYASPTKDFILGTFTAADDGTTGTQTGGISDIRVNRKFASDTDFTTILTMNDLTNSASNTETEYVAKLPIDLDKEGRIYEIIVSDYAGNSTTTYIRLFLDTTAPFFVENDADSHPIARATKGTINSDGTAYYYNEMLVSFTAKDFTSASDKTLASGAKTYSLLGGTSGSTVLKTASLENGTQITLHTADDFASHTNGALSVTISDKLTNTRTESLYLADGTKVTRNWIRDTAAPRIQSVSVEESQYGRLGTSSSETILYYAQNNKNDGKTYDFAVSVTASDGLSSSTGTDGGIMGYFVSAESSADSYSSVSTAISVTPSAYIDSTGSGTAYLYAVDYAGNISAGFPVKIQKDENMPVISAVSASGTSEKTGTDVIFFNTNSSVIFTLKDANTQIVEYGLARAADGTGDNFANTTKSISLAKNTEQQYTANFSGLSDSEKATESFTLYVYATNTQGNTTYYVLPEGTAKTWTYDGEAATVKNVVSSDEKTYPRSSAIENGGTLYYNTAISQISLKVTFNEDASGITGYKLGSASAETTTISLADDNSATISVSVAVGTLSIFGVDALGNVSAEFKITLSGIAHAPNISAVSVTKDAGVLYQNETTGSYYYNSSVGTLTLTPSISTDSTGIVGFTTNSSASQKDSQSSATAYAKAAATSDSSETVTLYAVNGVGAVSASGFTVTLIRDTQAPSVSALTVSASGENSVNASDTNASDTNASGSTLYYNSTATSVVVTAADSSAGIAKYAIGTSATAPASDSADWKTTSTISLPEATNAQFYIFVKDNVENVFVKEFSNITNAKYKDYSGAETQIPSGATWTSDTIAPTDVNVTAATADGVFTGSDGTVYFSGESITFNFSATEAAKILRYGYKLSGGTGDQFTEIGAAAPSVTVSPSTTGTSTLTVWAIDYAGNKSAEQSVTITADRTTPTISGTWASGTVYDKANSTLINTGAAGNITVGATYFTNAGGYTVSLSISSLPASGIKEWTATGLQSGESLSPSDNKETATLTLKAMGTVTVTVTSNVGKTAEFAITTQSDTTKPEISDITLLNSGSNSVNLNGGTLYFNNSATSISAVSATDGTGSDAGSGISGTYAIVVSATEPESAETNTAAGALKLGDLSGTLSSNVWICTKDKVGNFACKNLSEIAVNYTPHGSDGTAASQTQAGVGTITQLVSLESVSAPTFVAIASAHSSASGNGVYLPASSLNSSAKTATLFYSTALLSGTGNIGTTLKLALTPASGTLLMGYKIDSGSIVYISDNTASLDLSSEPTQAKIYAVDYAGNVSSDSFTLTLTKDETKPVIRVALSAASDSTIGKITSDNTNLISVNTALASGTTYYSNSRYYTVSVSVAETGSGTSDDLVKVDTVAFTESPYSITVSGVGNRTITAKDNVGNEAEQFVLTTALDNAGPVLSDLRITNTDANHSVNASGTTIYYNPDFVKVSATATDARAISAYLISDSDTDPDADSIDWVSATGISNVALGAFSGKALYLYAKDILDNVSEAYAFAGNAQYVSANTASGSTETAAAGSVWTSDSENPAKPAGIALTNPALNGNGLYLASSDSTTIFYNKEKLGSGVTSVSITPMAASGVMGWRLSAGGTDFDTSLALPFETSPAEIYAVDYAGNVSEAYELTLTEETSASVSVAVKFKSGKLIAENGTQLISSGTALSQSDTYYTNGAYTVSLDANANSESSGIKEASSSANGAITLSSGSGETEIPEPTAAGSTVTLTVKTNVGTEATFALKTILDKTGPAVTGITLGQKSGAQTTVAEKDGIVYYNSGNTYISEVTIDTDSEKFPLAETSRTYMILSAETGYAADSASGFAAGNESFSLGAHESATESSAIYIATEDLFGNVKYTKLSDIASIKYSADSTAGAGTALKWQSLDSVSAPTGVALSDSSLSGAGAWLDSNALYYNADLIPSGKTLAVTPSHDSNLVTTFSTSDTGAAVSAAITVSASTSDTESTLPIYAVDIVGNVSAAYTLTLIPDSTAVSAFEQNVGEGNYEKTNLFTGYIGDQKINCYNGLSLKVTLTKNKVSPTAYALVFADESATEIAEPADSVWQTISESNYTDSVLTVPFGEFNAGVTASQKAWLWIKDEVGTKTRYATALGNPASDERRTAELLWLPYTAASVSMTYALDTENRALYLSGLASGYPVQTLTFVENETNFLSGNTISQVVVYKTKDGDSSEVYTISGGLSLTSQTVADVTSVVANLTNDYIVSAGVVKLVFTDAISDGTSSLVLSSVQVKCSEDSASSTSIALTLASDYTTLLSASVAPTGFFSGLVSRATHALSSVLKTRSMSHEERVALKEENARQKAEARALKEKQRQERGAQTMPTETKMGETASQWQGLGEEFDAASRELDANIEKLSASGSAVNESAAHTVLPKESGGTQIAPKAASVTEYHIASEERKNIDSESVAHNSGIVICMLGVLLLMALLGAIFIRKGGKKN